ncbi:MAG: DUF397 domain-containing protein [Actinomycetota bacterium]|nr:DUF397 domain-containing protein [Actinomycetota bacterium]
MTPDQHLGGPVRRKSSYSSSSADCVEIAAAGSDIAIRDSKDPDGPVLACPRAGMGAFLAGVKACIRPNQASRRSSKKARSNQETPR